MTGGLRHPVRLVRALRDEAPEPRNGRLTDAWALAAVVVVPVAIAVHAVLPPKYFTDSKALQSIALGEYLPLQDTSFLYVGKLYGGLGVARSPLAAGALGLGLAMVALWAALRRARGRLTPGAIFLVAVYVCLAAVYLSQFSKDVWVLPVSLVLLVAPPGWAGEVLCWGAMAGYAFFFRPYWYLVLAIFAALRLVTVLRRSAALILLTVALVVVVATVAAPMVTGKPLTDARTSVNESRVASQDAVTAITPVAFGSGPIADSASNLLMLGQMVVPTPLVAQASPIYLAYFVVILAIWLLFGRALFDPRRGLLATRPTRGSPAGDVAAGSAGDPEGRALRWATFVLAFLTTQSFFEPDYGSYVKHLAPVLPVLIAATLAWRGTPLLRPFGDDRAGHRSQASNRPCAPTGPRVFRTLTERRSP